MKMVKLRGLGTGESLWVNPAQVSAVWAITALNRGPAPLQANTVVIASGAQLYFPDKVEVILAALEGKPLLDA